MSRADCIREGIVKARAAGIVWGKAGVLRATANKAAADAHAALLRAVLFELLTAPSHSKRKTLADWHLTDLAQKLNTRGLQTRTAKPFRPMTVKRLLDRLPDVVKAAKAANNAKSSAGFKCAIGVDAPMNVTEVVTGMNELLANSKMGTPKA